MSYYIYNKQGKHEGPYDEEQLRSMLKAGRLDKDELVSQNGLSSWSPIHLVLEARRSPNSSHQEEKKYRLFGSRRHSNWPFRHLNSSRYAATGEGPTFRLFLDGRYGQLGTYSSSNQKY